MLDKIIEGLKLPTKTFFALLLATAILLFSPNQFLHTLGLGNLVVKYRTYIGAVFVLAVCVCLTSAFSAVAKFVWPWIVQAYWLSHGRHRLHNLNPEEKNILSHYIRNETREQTLPINSGSVKVLEMEKIIFRASSLGSLDGFSYALQPWAWEYLNKKPRLLE